MLISSEAANPNPFYCLPDELILKIFNCLSLSDLKSVVTTSKQFASIGLDPLFLGSKGLFDQKACILIQNIEPDSKLSKNHKKILNYVKRLCLSCENKHKLPIIGKYCRNLETLALWCAGNEELLSLPKKIKALVINHSKEIDDKGIDTLISINSLVSIALFECDKITDNALESLSKRKKVKDLVLWNCPQITDKTLHYLNQIPTLSTLSLIDSQITDEGIEKFPHIRNLTKLDLSRCSQLTDKTLHVLYGCCQITSLSLRDNLNFTSGGLSGLKRLKTIQSLNLSNCPGVNQSLLVDLATIENLRELILCGCSITDSCLQTLRQCKQLKKLKLADCLEIHDSGVMYIADMENLEFIDLRRCTGITKLGLATLASIVRLKVII